MENHQLILKKFSNFFPSSFTSCQFRTLPDVADSSISITKSNKIPLSENDLTKPHKNHTQGRKYPPVTPLTTVINKTDVVNKFRNVVSSSSNSSRWFTSGGDDGFETDTFFSLSSNSGDSFRLKKSSRRFNKHEIMKSIDETVPNDAVSSKRGEQEYSDYVSAQVYYGRRRKTGAKRRRRRTRRDDAASMGESYAVEKRSIDPRGDFRASMVEMIIEKQMFGEEDLERLLVCFLKLNKVAYHGLIFDVFSEICQTLFSN